MPSSQTHKELSVSPVDVPVVVFTGHFEQSAFDNAGRMSPFVFFNSTNQVGLTSDDECEACSAGRWSNQVGLTSNECRACSAGRWSDTAWSDCKPNCFAGSYMNCTNENVLDLENLTKFLCSFGPLGFESIVLTEEIASHKDLASCRDKVISDPRCKDLFFYSPVQLSGDSSGKCVCYTRQDSQQDIDFSGCIKCGSDQADMSKCPTNSKHLATYNAHYTSPTTSSKSASPTTQCTACNVCELGQYQDQDRQSSCKDDCNAGKTN